MLNLAGTPYSLDNQAENEIIKRIQELEKRINRLRSQEILTQKTLTKYYGERRFEQVAESNAIEGSTLDVGETELAVKKGITTTGHDPAYARDAIALDKALERLNEMAKDRQATTDIKQLHDLHKNILGDRDNAGVFRNEPIRIKGADHQPPESWPEVMQAMEECEKWSLANPDLSSVIKIILTRKMNISSILPSINFTY